MGMDNTMMHCAVRLIGDEESDDGTAMERRTIGSAFLVTIPSRLIPDRRYGYLLTAHHVLNGHFDDVEMEAPDPYVDGEMHPKRRIRDWRHPIEKFDLAIAPFNDHGP